MSIKIALAGNPNCGKTTLFNALTGSNQYVGNWPGVTVEKKEGRLKGQKDVLIQDLPGVYSLSPYTLEEIVTRDYLVKERPDTILNIVDGVNLERNLYLTIQLMELGLPVVVGVNMMDLVRRDGGEIDPKKLEKALGSRVVEMSALKNQGVMEAAQAAVELAQSRPAREQAQVMAERLRARLKTDGEGEADEEETAGRQYDYVGEIVSKEVRKKRTAGSLSVSDKIDRIVTNRILALPIFVGVMFLVYAIAMGGWAVSIGTRATGWANDILFAQWVPSAFDALLGALGVGEESWVYGLVQEGIVGGVGAVLGFVPQMLVLFLLLAVLEDVGYMARVAFIMDRIFRRFGLSGKSFIPMLVATGCGVPGIMASRTIEQARDRKMTIMTTGFIPCGAKMPIIGLFAGALFGGSPLVAASAFFIGVGAVIISGIILKKMRAFAGEPAPFVMELPAYHVPAVGNVLRAAWERGWSFVKRAGTVILLSTIVLWFLQGYGFADGVFQAVEDNNNSLLAAIGSSVAWIFYPLGWTGDMAWKSAVATFTGLIAKENVVNTLGTLYHYAGEGDLMEDSSPIWTLVAADFTALSAYSFMIFNLLCAPCFAAMGAIRREMNSPKWTAAAIGYMCAFAYGAAMIVYQVGGLMTGEISFGILSAVAIGFLVGLLFLLFRKGWQNRDERRQLGSISAAAQ